jgi:hypothetical protein
MRDRNCFKTSIYWVAILSVFAVIISVIALCNNVPRTEFDFDYLGAIIGVVSILTTVLIGWNIYQLIDFNKHTEKVKRLSDDVKRTNKKIEENNNEVLYSICSQMVFSTIQKQSLDEKEKWFITYNGIYAMKFAYQAKKTDDLKYMAGLIKGYLPDIIVSKEDVDSCLNILRNIKVDNAVINDDINFIFKRVSELFSKGFMSENPNYNLIGEWELTNPTPITRIKSLIFKEDGMYDWEPPCGEDYWSLNRENKVLTMWANQVPTSYDVLFGNDNQKLTLNNQKTSEAHTYNKKIISQ